jgi:hypothetical protein
MLGVWNDFRGTLYFLAFVLTVAILFFIVIVHRQKHPSNAPAQHPNVAPGQSPPIDIYGTPLYDCLRVAWFISSIITFLWVVNAMYSYWTIAPAWKSASTGPLNSFLVAYDKKFVASVVCVTIYLCWPLANILLEIGIFFAGVVPWLIFRSTCKQGLDAIRFPETPTSELPGWVRTDVFFTEFDCIKRLGCTKSQWKLLTGSDEPFVEGCCPVDPNAVAPPVAGFGGDRPPVPGWGGNQMTFPPSQQMGSPPGFAQPQANSRGGSNPGTVELLEQQRAHHAMTMPPPTVATPQSGSLGFAVPQGAVDTEDPGAAGTSERKEKKSKHDKEKKSKDKKDKEKRSKERRQSRRDSEADPPPPSAPQQ